MALLKRTLTFWVAAALVTCSMSIRALAGITEAWIVRNRVLVLFKSQRSPADAAKRVQNAGGKLIANYSQVGIAVVAPKTVSSDSLVKNLKRDTEVQDADFDRVLSLIAPDRIAIENGLVSPATDFPHPLPSFSPALPADFFYTSSPQQWSVKRVGATGGPFGNGPGAWDTTLGAGVKIAILDTGANPLHPDISSKLTLNVALTSYDPAVFGTPNCEVADPSNPPFDLAVDQNGHGTWTTSLAAGAIGGGLMVGVAPEAQILSIKVLRNIAATNDDLKELGVPQTPFNQCLFRNGSGFFSWVLQGMLIANAAGADVISMSLGGFVPHNARGAGPLFSLFNRVANFVTSHGSIVLAAAGNAGLNLNKIGPFAILPAEASNIIAVVATTNPDLPPPGDTVGIDHLASYSDFGPGLHGLSAPGGDLPVGGCAFGGSPCNPTGFVRGACSAGVPETTTPDPATFPAAGPPQAGTSFGCFSLINTGSNHLWYVQATGTSAATPIAAGVAALVKSANPRLSPSQIRTILQRTAEDIGKPGYDKFFNFGLVDATAAVAAAR